jgi:hypothetical protein
MSIITKMRKQICVYWGNPVPTGDGLYSYDPPVEIPCRWDGTNQLFTNSQGEELVSKAVVFVDRDMPEGGFLYLGTLASLEDYLDSNESSQDLDPRLVSGAGKIRSFSKTPNLKATEFVRKAIL